MKALDSRLLRRAAAVRRYLVVSSLIAVTSGLLVIVSAFAISELVVLAFQDRAGLGEMRGALIVLGLAVLGRAVLAWGGQVAAHRASADVKSELRRELLSHTIRLGPSWLARQQIGDLATLATHGTDAIDDYFAQYLPTLITAFFLPATVVVVVLSQDVLAGAHNSRHAVSHPIVRRADRARHRPGDATSMANVGGPWWALPGRRPGPAHVAPLRSSEGSDRSDSPKGR